MSKIITVRIDQVYIEPSSQDGQVVKINVTENGVDNYDLEVTPVARIHYYFKNTYKDLLVEGTQVLAAKYIDSEKFYGDTSSLEVIE